MRDGPRKKAVPGQAGMPADLPRLYEESQVKIKELTLLIGQKDQEIAGLKKETGRLREALSRVDRHLEQCREICADRETRS